MDWGAPSSTSPPCASVIVPTASDWSRRWSASLPRLLVLDPLVRLHGVDENTVAEVALILGFLRDLQRRFHTAVLLVHHARKSGATRPGQALRGSSDLHAWGDSNLYLQRRDRQILMTVEHRAAPGLNDIEVELADHGKGSALRLRQVDTAETAPQPETPEQRILQALAEADTPLPQRQIRDRTATRPATVAETLQRLLRQRRVESAPEGGYRIPNERAVPTRNASSRQDPLPLPVTASNP